MFNHLEYTRQTIRAPHLLMKILTHTLWLKQNVSVFLGTLQLQYSPWQLRQNGHLSRPTLYNMPTETTCCQDKRGKYSEHLHCLTLGCLCRLSMKWVTSDSIFLEAKKSITVFLFYMTVRTLRYVIIWPWPLS